MGFTQALSGLNSASDNLDVIGNNVANANTVGFKSSRAEFADVYANTVMGTSSLAIGIGTKTAAVAQQFTQGSITATSNPFDVAISGNGFFRLDTNGSISYSRNGQFHLDANGYLVNANNQNVTGYMANATTGKLDLSQAVPLQFTVNTLPANATTKVTQGSTLDSRATEPTTVPFDSTNSDTYTNSTSMVIYDSLGNPHTQATYYVKTATPNQWDIYTTVDGVAPQFSTDGGATYTGTYPMVATFDTSGNLTGVTDSTTPTPVTLNPSSITLQAPSATGASGLTPTIVTSGAADLTFNFNISNTTQTGITFANAEQSQDGFTAGTLTNFSIDKSGYLTATYSNQQTRTQGQLVLAQFTNPQGLIDAGDNNYLETNASGTPRVGLAGTSNFGVLNSGSVEDSNVDLTAELVNMITAQRVYQANAQTIKTEDTVMNTLVNLR